jgi:hypothetical protein
MYGEARKSASIPPFKMAFKLTAIVDGHVQDLQNDSANHPLKSSRAGDAG